MDRVHRQQVRKLYWTHLGKADVALDVECVALITAATMILSDMHLDSMKDEYNTTPNR